MTTPFGPQLIGETEKTLNALLVRHLGGSLTEPEWVTLRVASTLGAVDDDGLVATVAERAHFGNTAQLVVDLTARGLLADGRLTPAGSDVLMRMQASMARDTTTVFAELDGDDVAATQRVLNEILGRARAVLAG